MTIQLVLPEEVEETKEVKEWKSKVEKKLSSLYKDFLKSPEGEEMNKQLVDSVIYGRKEIDVEELVNKYHERIK